MKNGFIFIVGGTKSGKSAFAVEKAKLFRGRVVFFATCGPEDSEMKRRVAEHRQRRPAAWSTKELKKDIIKELNEIDGQGKLILLDCLTLWLSRMLCENEQKGIGWFLEKTEDLKSALTDLKASVILVSNEVGMSVVPANKLARKFADIQGAANQIMAKAAGSVYCMRSCLAEKLK